MYTHSCLLTWLKTSKFWLLLWYWSLLIHYTDKNTGPPTHGTYRRWHEAVFVLMFMPEVVWQDAVTESVKHCCSVTLPGLPLCGWVAVVPECPISWREETLQTGVNNDILLQYHTQTQWPSLSQMFVMVDWMVRCLILCTFSKRTENRCGPILFSI